MPPQPPRRPWHGPPDNVAGCSVALNLVLGRSERAAIWIASADVYPEGFEFEVEIRHRFDEGEIEHPFFMHHPRRRRRHGEDELDPELVRFGIEFSDGRKATNLGRHPPFALPGAPDEPPEGPVLSPSRGGGGGSGRWHHGFWAWPLPPEGPLAFVSEWPVAGIAETRTEIDSALIRAAAADVVELWPQDDRAAASGGGGQSAMLQRVRGEPRPRHARPWHELTIESGQKTQLIDITDRVRGGVAVAAPGRGRPQPVVARTRRSHRQFDHRSARAGRAGTRRPAADLPLRARRPENASPAGAHDRLSRSSRSHTPPSAPRSPATRRLITAAAHRLGARGMRLRRTA